MAKKSTIFIIFIKRLIFFHKYERKLVEHPVYKIICKKRMLLLVLTTAEASGLLPISIICELVRRKLQLKRLSRYPSS